MKKEFVSYEQALALKELGFDEHVIAYYLNGEFEIAHDGPNRNSDIESWVVGKNNCSAPLYQQAFRFFRDKYGLYQFTTNDFIEGFSYKIYAFEGTKYMYAVYENQEEAEEECLGKLIELAKESK